MRQLITLKTGDASAWVMAAFNSARDAIADRVLQTIHLLHFEGHFWTVTNRSEAVLCGKVVDATGVKVE